MKNVLLVLTAVLVVPLLLLGAFFLVYSDGGAGSVYDDRLAELKPTQQQEMAAIYGYLDHRNDNIAFLTLAERAHMNDVRRVFDAMKIMFAVVVAVLISEVVFIITKSKRGRHSKRDRRTDRDNHFDPMRKGFLYGGAATLAIVLLLALSSLFDFSSFWTAFHHVLFPQGNWTFPYDSVLITLFPEEFFQNFARQVLLAAGAFSLIAMLAARTLRRKK